MEHTAFAVLMRSGPTRSVGPALGKTHRDKLPSCNANAPAFLPPFRHPHCRTQTVADVDHLYNKENVRTIFCLQVGARGREGGGTRGSEGVGRERSGGWNGVETLGQRMEQRVPGVAAP